MDRVTFYYGSQLRDVDLLGIGQNAMVGLAKLSEAVLGTSAATVGLGVTPGAGLTVSVAPGQLYQVEPLEATIVGSPGLPADTTHFVVKQGLSLDAQIVSGLSAPVGVGTSINYLIEAQYQDSDTSSAVLGYYNAASPTTQWSGPGNTGSANTTIRKGVIALQATAGAAATTGTQTTPNPDSGWVGIAVVSVAYGAASLASSNIAAYAGNPVIPTTLPAIPGQIQAQSFVAWHDVGAANAYVINPVPAISAAPAGTRFVVSIANANTGASTLTVNGLTMNVVMNDRTALGAGYLVANMQAAFVSDGAYWQLEAPSTTAYTSGGGGGGGGGGSSSVGDTGSGLAYQIGWVL